VQPLVGHVEQPDRRLSLGVPGLGVHKQGAGGGRRHNGQPRARGAEGGEEGGDPAYGHGQRLSQQRPPSRGPEQLGEGHAHRRPLRQDHRAGSGGRHQPSGRDHDPGSGRQPPSENQRAGRSGGNEQRQPPVQQPPADHPRRSRDGARARARRHSFRRGSPRRGLDPDAKREGTAGHVPIHLGHRAPAGGVRAVGERGQRRAQLFRVTRHRGELADPEDRPARRIQQQDRGQAGLRCLREIEQHGMRRMRK
jgi:hypothetical protein